MTDHSKILYSALGLISLAGIGSGCKSPVPKPNIVIIYADDLGYGDISCYGATSLTTSNIDRFAKQGLRFTNAHCSSATSTPSRYSLLTGQYAWRKEGTGIAPGDASCIIDTGRTTIASVLKRSGYTTAVIGKWHLGLGPDGGPDWNGEIKPGPGDLGFDHSFIIPATGDRVPCVFVEDRHVANLDPDDPITVSYKEKVGNWPTGKEHPELLKMKPSHGHDMTIINGISRIGYMTGGRSALWVDEEISTVLTARAVKFMTDNRDKPFFLYFATHDIHVPRVPNHKFVGKSGMGPRGDAILEFDRTVGEVLRTLDSLNLSDNTIVIITSDNGPVVDDGYRDHAVELLGSHRPAGPLRGGKYSAFDGGTRIPFIIRWPGNISAGKSDAMISQVDLLASFASLVGQPLNDSDGPDSYNNIDILLGRSDKSRDWVIEQSANGRLSIISGDWKYIQPGPGAKISMYTNIELGNDTLPQLYNLKTDIGEKNNIASKRPTKVNDLSSLLKRIVDVGK